MRPKKEHYRQKLPHFQQPGQWYSVTVSLNGAMPKGAMAKYSLKLENAKNQYHQFLNREGSPTRDMDSIAIEFPKSMFLHPKQNETKNFELGNSKSQKEEAKKSLSQSPPQLSTGIR